MANNMMEWSVRDAREQIVSGSTMMNGWEIKKELGRGGFGEVWLAEKSRFGITDQAAIKVIRIPRDSSDINAMRAEGMSDSRIQTELHRNVENAVREVRAMVELRNHPSIVPCEEFDVIQYETDGTWEIDIRMQLLKSLPDWTENRDVKPEDVIRMGVSLSDLLAVCERKNILHRDIKPANIFVDQLNNFKLGDFGLARVISDTSSVHSKGVGAEAFMAPEVFKSGKYDHRADIYSLGLVMYWLLNHRNLPFFTGNASRNEAITKRMSGEALPVLSGVDPALDQVIRKACDPNPNKRWKTASEFHDALLSISIASSHGSKKTIVLIGAIVLATLLGGYTLIRLLNGLPFFPWNVQPTTSPQQTITVPTSRPESMDIPDEIQNEDTIEPETTAEPATADTLPTGEMLNRYGKTGDKTNFRTKPSSMGDRVFQVPADTYVYLIANEVNEADEIWTRVNVDGQEGYMKSEYIYAVSEEESNAYNSSQLSPAPVYRYPSLTPTSTPTPTPTPEPTSILDSIIESETPLFTFHNQKAPLPIANKPVFTAPYDNAYRMSNGKETLGADTEIEDCAFIELNRRTNPEIEDNEYGYYYWLLVRYVTVSGETRIGNVPVSPSYSSFRGHRDFAFLPMTATQTIQVTNNPSLPFFSELNPGDYFYILGRFSEYSDWLYIECDYRGKKTRGFIKYDSSCFQLVDYQDVDVKVLFVDDDNGNQYKTITVSLPKGCLDIKRHLPEELYFNGIRFWFDDRSPIPVSIDQNGKMSVSNYTAEYQRNY